MELSWLWSSGFWFQVRYIAWRVFGYEFVHYSFSSVVGAFIFGCGHVAGVWSSRSRGKVFEDGYVLHYLSGYYAFENAPAEPFGGWGLDADRRVRGWILDSGGRGFIGLVIVWVRRVFDTGCWILGV